MILSYLMSKSDSIILHKIDFLTKSITAIENKPSVNSWLPLMASVITGGLVLFAQYLDRKSKIKENINNELNSLYSESEMILALILSYVKELSIIKNQKFFWYQATLKSRKLKHVNKEKLKKLKLNLSNNELRIKELEEIMKRNLEVENGHYRSLRNSDDLITPLIVKIDKSIAEYYGKVSKFKSISKEKIDLSIIKKIIIDVNLFEDIDDCEFENIDLAKEFIIKNKKTLCDNYILKFEDLSKINKSLKEICE